MDATLSFGVTVISEVPSNPQLTIKLAPIHTQKKSRTHFFVRIAINAFLGLFS